MFIAMDRTNYRCLPRISIGFFLSSRQEYLKALPESCILAEDPWLTFWQSIIATSQECLANMPAPMYRESPLHDVKLVFWIIVLFFIQASPCNAKEEKEETSKDAINHHTNVFCTLSNNYIGEDDGRIPLLEYSEENWRRALHAELHCFSPMLCIMASYFTNTWHYFEDAQGDNNVHGHEAMRRILWHAIKSMKADIPLHTEPLEVIMSSGANYYTMNLRKGNK